MKATKKIVGATAALVAALALSAGSTFAWFTANTEVSAEGMNVIVSVPTNLYIYNGYTDDINNVKEVTVDFNEADNFHTLLPAKVVQNADTKTTLDVQIPDGSNYSQAPTVGTAGSSDPSHMLNVGTITANSGAQNTPDQDVSKYASAYTLTIVRKTDVEGTFGLNAHVAINTNNPDDTSYSYLKCGIICGENFEYMDVNTDFPSYNGFYDLNNFATGLENNTAINLAIVLWFEGDDQHCYSNNAINVGQFDVTVSFTLAN